LSTLLQIVPKVPGGIDGVGDYALTIAEKLLERFETETVFAAFNVSVKNVRGFEVVSVERVQSYDRVLLHYVNYGFQKRGIPFRLLSILRDLRRVHRGKLVTIFHEFYASGPPWTSAFWLQPLQKGLAKSIAELSDSCIVSSNNFLRELNRMVPKLRIELHPVPSGVGEPPLSQNQIVERDPNRWAIFGGTALVERSLRSFRQALSRIPDSVAPKKLFVLGGHENPATRSLLVDLGLETDCRPQIAANEASEILATCSFAWFNYFHRPDVEPSVILKSSAFASVSAHAVIPVFPHGGSSISIDADQMPGPFFIEGQHVNVPGADARVATAIKIYDWYQRHASSEHLVAAIANMFGLSAGR